MGALKTRVEWRLAAGSGRPAISSSLRSLCALSASQDCFQDAALLPQKPVAQILAIRRPGFGRPMPP